jgi:type I restriction enzyme, S subunit
MNEVALGTLIRPARVSRAGQQALPLLSMTMHNGLVDQTSKFKKRIASDDVSDYKVVHRGQLVVGFPIDEGVLDFQVTYDSGIVSPAYRIWELTDPTRIDRSYLRRYLRSPQALSFYRTKLQGSTARRRSLPNEIFLALSVPVPSIEEQRQIAVILDQVDVIQTKHRRIISALDQLVTSIFVSMFGTPLGRNQSEKKVEIGLISSIMTGNSPARADPTNFGNSIEWIKSDNLGGRVATVAREWLSETGRKSARIAPRGSVLVTCIAGSPNSIGKASILDRDAAFNQQINAVLPTDTIDPLFLLEQLKAEPRLVQLKSTSGMKGLVSKTSFESIRILLPSIERQQEFAARVRAVDAQRSFAVRALAVADELSASLQSRAFRGKL